MPLSNDEIQQYKKSILTSLNGEQIAAYLEQAPELAEDAEIKNFLASYNYTQADITPEMLANDDIMLKLVQKYGRILEWCTPEQRKNTDFINSAIQSYGAAIQYADLSSFTEKEIKKLYREALGYPSYNWQTKQPESVLQYLPENFREDVYLITDILQYHYKNRVAAEYAYIGTAAKKSQEIILAVVGAVPEAVHNNPDLLAQYEFRQEALRRNPQCLQHMAEFASEPATVGTAVSFYPSLYNGLSEDLKSHDRVVQGLLCSNMARKASFMALSNKAQHTAYAVRTALYLAMEFSDLPEDVQNDLTVIAELITQNNDIFLQLPTEIKKHEELLLIALQGGYPELKGGAFETLRDHRADLTKNPDFMLKLLGLEEWLKALKYADASLFLNPSFIQAIAAKVSYDDKDFKNLLKAVPELKTNTLFMQNFPSYDSSKTDVGTKPVDTDNPTQCHASAQESVKPQNSEDKSAIPSMSLLRCFMAVIGALAVALAIYLLLQGSPITACCVAAPGVGLMAYAFFSGSTASNVGAANNLGMQNS
jgi:hypothetical protein